MSERNQMDRTDGTYRGDEDAGVIVIVGTRQ